MHKPGCIIHGSQLEINYNNPQVSEVQAFFFFLNLFHHLKLSNELS